MSPLVGLLPETASALLRHSAKHVAMSMIHGDYPERDRAYDMALELEREAPGFIDYVKRCIAEAGKSPEAVWQIPRETPDEAARGLIQVNELRSVLSRHIAGAYISGGDHQNARARELETALDQAGLNVDSQVERLVLNEMRLPPSSRGTNGRADDCPF